MNESLAELHRQGVFLKPEKAQEWDPDGKIEVIFDRFVKSDMRLSCSQGSLPSTIMEAHDAPLNGYFVLQVLECIDISESNRNRKAEPPFTAHRTLKICFTDGQTTAVALELSPSKALSNLDAGAKVVVSNSPLVFRGVILLEPRHIALLSLTKAPPKEEPPTDSNGPGPPPQQSLQPQPPQQQPVPPKQESSAANNQPIAGPNPPIPPGGGGGLIKNEVQPNPQPVSMHQNPVPEHIQAQNSGGVLNQYHHVNPAQQQQQQLSAPLLPPASSGKVSHQNQNQNQNQNQPQHNMVHHAPAGPLNPRSPPLNQGTCQSIPHMPQGTRDGGGPSLAPTAAGISSHSHISSHSGMRAPQDQLPVLHGNVKMQHAMPMPSTATPLAASVQQQQQQQQRPPNSALNSGRYDHHLHPTMNMRNSRSPSPSMSLSTTAGGVHTNRSPSPNLVSPAHMPHLDNNNNIRSPSPRNPVSPAHMPPHNNSYNIRSPSPRNLVSPFNNAPGNDNRSPSPRDQVSSHSHHNFNASTSVLPPAIRNDSNVRQPAIHLPPWSHGQRPSGAPPVVEVVHNQSLSEATTNGPTLGKVNFHDPNGQKGGMGQEYNKENSSSVQTRSDGIAPEHGKDVLLPQSEGHCMKMGEENLLKKQENTYQAPTAAPSSNKQEKRNSLQCPSSSTSRPEKNPYQIPAAASSSNMQETNPYQKIPGAFSSSTREENPYQIPAVSTNGNPYAYLPVASSNRITENPYENVGIIIPPAGDNPTTPAHNMPLIHSTASGRSSSVNKNPLIHSTPMVSALSNLFFAPNPVAAAAAAPIRSDQTRDSRDSKNPGTRPGTPLPPTPATNASRLDICPTPPVHEDEMIEFIPAGEVRKGDGECPTPPAHEDEVIEFIPGGEVPKKGDAEEEHENGGMREEDEKKENLGSPGELMLPGEEKAREGMMMRDGGASQKEKRAEDTNVSIPPAPTSASVKHALVRKVFQLGGETVILLSDGEQAYNVVVPRQFHKHAVIGTEGWFACEGNTLVGFSQSPPPEAVLKAALQF